MAGEQIVVLVLLAIAFGVGWIARGDGRRRGASAAAPKPPERPPVGELIAAAEAALDRVVVACSAARAMATGTERDDPMRAVTLEVLTGALADLRPAVAGLAAELAPGGRHPLVEEAEDAAAAAALVEAWLADGGEPDNAEAARGLERAARDALARYRRLARAIAPLV